ncbi:MAG: hypothetical protein CMK92_04410 [Pseudomonas sp.]|nr:hypothetical protein [Pseudomonas sp.]|tara:strand:- start:399 stop:665 length:267 start_codon:yes stop_codon:yes gene_type:complete
MDDSEEDQIRRQLGLDISHFQNKLTDNQRNNILVLLTSNGAKVYGGLISCAYSPFDISETPIDVLKRIKESILKQIEISKESSEKKAS